MSNLTTQELLDAADIAWGAAEDARTAAMKSASASAHVFNLAHAMARSQSLLSNTKEESK